jgi:hypothetical protein
MAKSPSVSRDLVAVATEHHAAPTAMVRFGLVTEPEHARVVLAPFHQFKVGVGQELSGGFGHRSKNRLGGGFRTDLLNFERVRFIPNQAGMTLGARQKPVEDRRISPLPSLAFLNKRTKILAQRSRRI